MYTALNTEFCPFYVPFWTGRHGQISATSGHLLIAKVNILIIIFPVFFVHEKTNSENHWFQTGLT